MTKEDYDELRPEYDLASLGKGVRGKHFKERLVKEVTEETMDGESVLHKRLNAYLTKRFILDKDVPADECLAEADEIIKMVEDFYGITDKPEDLEEGM